MLNHKWLEPRLSGFRLCLLILACVHLFACAGSPVGLNMGESDYKVATAEPGQLNSKYARLPDLPARQLEKGDTVSLHLQQVYIQDFSEAWERGKASVHLGTVRGEIAVLARVFELTNGETLDFRQSATRKLGRLVYYTEDVRLGGTVLNGSALPIYGPIEYGGNPLIIELTILELDIAESNQIKGMLGTLANLGAKAYAPASPVLKALDAVGEQLLSGQQDDIELRYIFALYPGGGHKTLQYPRLVAGDYVVVRQEPQLKRRNPKNGEAGYIPIPWSTLHFDRNAGRLETCKTVDSTKACTPFRDSTYMVLQINSGFPSVGLDVAQRFSEFQAEIEANVDNTAFTQKLDNALGQFQAQAIEESDQEKVRALFGEAIEHAEAACATTGAERKHHVAELFDILVSRDRLPALPTAEGAPPQRRDFVDVQWARLLYHLRLGAGDAYKVQHKAILEANDPAALEAILDCKGESATTPSNDRAPGTT